MQKINLHNVKMINELERLIFILTDLNNTKLIKELINISLLYMDTTSDSDSDSDYMSATDEDDDDRNWWHYAIDENIMYEVDDDGFYQLVD